MKLPVLLLLLVICLGSLSCRKSPSKEKNITVATAANMQFAMEALVAQFTARTGISCEVIIGSSGKLTAQIKEGAPYDLFVAANLLYPEEIARSGRAKSPPEIYAYGTLVLWTLTEGLEPSLEVLSGQEVTHIALANPKTAPYGRAAEEVLHYYSLYDSLRPKLVFGESIAQTNQFIASGAAEIGFTSLSVVVSPAMKGKGKWIALDSAGYSPIEQAVVLLNRDEATGGAQLFYDFLLSEEAGQVLKNFGYSRRE